MLTTSLKTMEEVRTGSIFALPAAPQFRNWAEAWSSACTGMSCTGVRLGFFNSVRILVPSLLCSIGLASATGYALSFWQPRFGSALFAALVAGAFIPYQIFLYPLVRIEAAGHLYNSLAGIVMVHVVFNLPFLTLLFRNFYVGLPKEMVQAARIDGAGFWRIFAWVVLPVSGPVLIVAAILQVTAVWNDFLLGVVFGGGNNQPMTVLLSNMVNAELGLRRYNIDMAATLLTGAVPLIVYFASGRWFERGITSGAVKG